ncbi:MAG TPA: coenzyme F420-0:L-glutamate ligase [Anaerolineaceae bacterium]|nr:coenzyme F420-0:L-glutamate ligase [Anaerolineaceae bacterium]
MSKSRELRLSAIKGIPQIVEGDDLAAIIYKCLPENGKTLKDGDILVLAQKIVSKAEGRLVNMTTVTPSQKAIELAEYLGKRPELVEMILRESNEVLRTRPGTIIVEHKSGFVCANAGIDHSNVRGPWGNDEDWILLLPEDSNRSADLIRAGLEALSGKKLGVMIIDSYGRAWRNGIVGACIGLSGLPALVDMRGQTDMYNYQMRVTVIAAADELAAGASLMMGQTNEGTPVVLVRGFPYALRESSAAELVRDKKFDMFR